MKNLKLFLMMFMAVSLLSSSCKKDDDDNNDPVNPTTYSGSASLTIDGILYNVLQSNVEQETEGVVFLLKNSAADDIFTVAITEVPAIGETVTLGLNAPDGSTYLLVANGPIEGIISLIAGSGTVHRVSEKVYEIDAILYGGDTFTDEYTITGTITVGVINI